METYQTLAQFAGTFGLVFMFLVFVAVILWVYRPSAREEYKSASEIPFRHENRPEKERG